MSARLACAALALIVFTTPAHADPEDVGRPDRLAERAGSATLDRPLSAPFAMELTAGSEGSEVTVKASHKLSEANGIHSLSITGAAPLDKEKSEGGFALDGFTAKSWLKVEYTWAGFSGLLVDDKGASKRMCDEIKLATGKDYNNNCGSNYVALNAPDRLDEFDRLGFAEDAAVWIAGGFAKAGHSEFKFVDQAAVAEKIETETPWSIGIFGAKQPVWTRRLYMAKFEHQRTYKDADPRTVCPAPAPAPAPSVVCLTGPLGSPKKDTKDILSFEMRQRFSKHYALAAMTSYDFSNEKFGVEAPIYFIAGGDWTGGVRVSYAWDGEDDQSDNDELKIGVFVSKAFKLYN